MAELGVPVTIHAVTRAKISDGKSVVITAPTGGTVAGLFYLVGGWFGAAFATVAAGSLATLNLEQAEYETPSAQVVASPAFTAGGLVFWDATASRFTPVATNNRLVGRVTEVLIGNAVRFILYDQAHLVTRAGAMPDIGAAPTQANFNTLLALLRTAGVITP